MYYPCQVKASWGLYSSFKGIIKNRSLVSSAAIHVWEAAWIAVTTDVRFRSAAVNHAVLLFSFLQSTVSHHGPSSLLTGQTGELHGEYVQLIICLFSRSAVTSAVPCLAARTLDNASGVSLRQCQGSLLHINTYSFYLFCFYPVASKTPDQAIRGMPPFLHLGQQIPEYFLGKGLKQLSQLCFSSPQVTITMFWSWNR